eukprot:6117266-Prymnesium_polylepis.1
MFTQNQGHVHDARANNGFRLARRSGANGPSCGSCAVGVLGVCGGVSTVFRLHRVVCRAAERLA